MIQNTVYVQGHLRYLWNTRNSLLAHKFCTQKDTQYTNITRKNNNIVTIIIATQHHCTLYIRTDSKLFRSWYRSTTWNITSDVCVISYSKRNLLYNQKNNIV